jgi:hypothetical protein
LQSLRRHIQRSQLAEVQFYLVDNIDETDCCDRLFVQVWCMVDALFHGTGWCMVDALVYGMITGCLVQFGSWLMHLFMVQVDYILSYRLMHG